MYTEEETDTEADAYGVLVVFLSMDDQGVE